MVAQKTKVLIVDDHPVLRRGLIELIHRHADLEVCGEADGVTDALQMVKNLKPDLVVIDLSLKDGHGLDLIKDLQARKNPPKMLVVSMHEEATYAERVLRAGAQGFLPKSEAVDKIVEAMRQIMQGEIYLNRKMATRVLHGMVSGGPHPAGAPEEILSDRELQVFEMLGNGQGSREISDSLCLSIKTIDTYREHIKQKLGLTSANELIFRAVLWAHAERPKGESAKDPSP